MCLIKHPNHSPHITIFTRDCKKKLCRGGNKEMCQVTSVFPKSQTNSRRPMTTSVERFCNNSVIALFRVEGHKLYHNIPRRHTRINLSACKCLKSRCCLPFSGSDWRVAVSGDYWWTSQSIPNWIGRGIKFRRLFLLCIFKEQAVEKWCLWLLKKHLAANGH